MSRIRSISAGELPAFASAAGAEHAAEQLTYLERLLDRGATRTGWCFLAETTLGIEGRIALYALPKVGAPEAVILLDARRDDLAEELLQHAVRVSRDSGSRTLLTVLDEPARPPQWQFDPDRRAGWLAVAGFRARRTTSRWERATDEARLEAPGRLRYRSFAEVGERAFLDAMERVSVDSLDRYTIGERERLGPEREAFQTYEVLRSMEWQPAWWELAFDETGALVGLVMPTLGPCMGTIGYIGVVPERRGRGHVHELLARGTATLLGTDAPVLRADTDVDNAPMAAAFVRGGWRSIGMRREFQVRL